MRQFDVAIIGGGASGLVAAIIAKRTQPAASVCILEKRARVGAKILETGNGRCNLSNLSLSSAACNFDAYNHPDFVEPLLAEHPYEDVEEFFASLGLAVVADAVGRVFPATDTANSVLDVLRLACDETGVELACGVEVGTIAQAAQGFLLEGSDTRISARSTILAIGGLGKDGTRLLSTLFEEKGGCKGEGSGLSSAPLAHLPALIAPTPVLCPLSTDTAPLKGLSGVRVRCTASLLAKDDEVPFVTERGELLFRDYGVSGIMAFDLSRYAEPDDVLSLDLYPAFTHDELVASLKTRQQMFSVRTAEDFLVGLLHPRIARAVLRMADIAPASCAADLSPFVLATALKDFRLRIQGMADTRKAQVTRGGIATASVDSHTLQVQGIPGLFAAGEALDIDGRCGGYNLHWAWASGMVAGAQAARMVAGAQAACSI